MGLAGLCHRPFGDGCTAQNAGDRCVAPPRRSTPGSPSSSRLALASLPQPELEVRSLRNAARQYPCARPSVLSPRAHRDWPRLGALALGLLLAASARSRGRMAESARPELVEVSERAGLLFTHVASAGSASWLAKYIVETMGSGGGFLDYDNDGWLDVYLVNSVGS